MKRRIVGVAALVVVLLVATIVGADTVRPPTATGPVYTVGQFLSPPSRRQPIPLRFRLQVGQIVRVRGVLQPLVNQQNVTPPAALSPAAGLFDTARFTGIGIGVYDGAPDPLAARLRGLPILTGLIPFPPTADHPLSGRLATYRLRVIRCRTIHPLCTAHAVLLQLADGGTP